MKAVSQRWWSPIDYAVLTDADTLRSKPETVELTNQSNDFSSSSISSCDSSSETNKIEAFEKKHSPDLKLDVPEVHCVQCLSDILQHETDFRKVHCNV